MARAGARARVVTEVRHGFEVVKARLSGNAAAASRQVVVLPGNPGMPGYYADYIAGLAERLGSDVEVTALGLRGHSAAEAGLNGDKFSVEDQVAHVAAYLKEIKEERVAVVGHSIGAYIGLLALAALRWPSKVSAVGLVTPFLQNNDENPDFAQKKFLCRLGFVWRLAWLLGWAARLMPAWLRRFLFRGSTTGMGPSAAALTMSGMLQGRTLMNYVYMGKTEFEHPWLRDGADDLLAKLKPKEKDRIFALYTQNDIWAPLTWCKKLRDKYGIDAKELSEAEALCLKAGVSDAPRVKGQAVGHAFGVTKVESDIVAGATVGCLAERDFQA